MSGSVQSEGKAARKKLAIKLLMLAAAVVALIALCAAGCIAVSVFSWVSEYSRVPDVSGMELSEATEVLGNAELRVVVVDRIQDISLGDNTVAEQHIVGGSYCPRNACLPVTVNVSGGMPIEQNAIPNVLYLTQDAASKTLAGYDVYIVSETCDWATDGLVIAQDADGNAITLTISHNPTERPDYVGCSLQEAMVLAQESAVACDVSYDCVSGAESGMVISCEPAHAASYSDVPMLLSVSAEQPKGLCLGLWLSSKSAQMLCGDQLKLIAREISFFQGQKSIINWTSSAPEVAVVDNCGNVYAVGVGQAVITASARGGKMQRSCELVVNRVLEEIQITVPDVQRRACIGSSYDYGGTLVTAVYSDGTTADVTASSDFADVDTSAEGEVLGVVKYTENSICRSASFIVAVAPMYADISQTELDVGVKCHKQLLIDTNIHGRIVWHSSDESVCAVDASGRLTGVKPGDCTVAARYNGKSIAKCSVSVKKAIFITIDDGPSMYTEQMLEILAKCGVKATFFVIGQPERLEMYKHIEEQGHTIGLHSYSHIYERCYASEDAFFDELYRLNDLLAQADVSPVKLFRFPGGSDTTKCEIGVTEQIIARAQAEGFYFCDWTEQYGRYSGEDYVIMLLHHTPNDTKKLERMIIRYQNNGYTFETISEDTEMIHFDISRNR